MRFDIVDAVVCEANAERICSCFNGCKDIQHPHIDVPALIKVAVDLKQALVSMPPPSEYQKLMERAGIVIDRCTP